MSKLKKYLSKQEITSLKTLKKAMNESQVIVTCVGLYNNGKSTLLNVLVKDFEFKTFKVADARETVVNKEFMFNGIKYVDTPGLNATYEDDKRVMEAIEKSDITLFVHTITTGEFNKKEIEFLESIQRYWSNPQEFIDRTIFVLSRIDNIENIEDIERTSQKMQQQIRDIFGSSSLIIPVSAEDYKEGMVEKENELIEESNIQKLEKLIETKSIKSKEDIFKTKKERFESKVEELRTKLNKKIEENRNKIFKLQEEQKEIDKAFEKDIDRIESTLENMYSRLK